MRLRPPALLVALAATAAVAVVPMSTSGSAGLSDPGDARSSSAADRATPRAASCPAVSGARPMPTAESVTGHALDASPPTPDEADGYLRALDAASPRIVTGVTGRSVQGRPLRYAVVGDPRNLSPARLRAISRGVRAVRGGPDPAAVRRAAAGPAIVWIGAGVHANEPSGVTAALALLRTLAADDGCATRRTLHGALAVVVPDQNPDGRERGTRTNAADVDLNRDWFAVSQPETAARLRLLRRYPPTVALDVHEQAGDQYFVPPYAQPVVAGMPRGTRRLADGPVSRAIGRALGGVGSAAVNRRYDLLYPGYADSATSLLFGAGGMTLEQGSDPPLAEKSRRHEAALGAALATVAADPAGAIRTWAAGFEDAVRDGRAGRGTTGDGVFGWILRTDHHRADALALADRLRRQDVRVRALRRPTRMRIDPLGPAGTAERTLPEGTLVVPAAQPLARWADVLLGRDADEAGGASAGADTWSAPRAAGIEAAVLRASVPAGALGAVPTPVRPGRGDGPAGGSAGAPVVFDGDSAAGTRLALAALTAGRPVTRAAGDALRTTADAAWLRRAAATGADVRAASGPAPGSPLAVPRVAVPADPTPLLTGPPAQLPALDRPAGWVSGALRAAGVVPTALAPASLDVGLPAGTTHLLLGPAPLPDGPPSAAGRAAVERFVRGGGTVIALGAAGTDAATSLGLSAVRTEPAAGRSAVAVRALPGPGRTGRALGSATSVIVAGEPRLVAPDGAAVALRAGSGPALAPSGAQGAGDGLSGRPLVVDEAVGAGHVLTVGFSPAFRRQSAGGEHVLLALLLAGG